MVSRKVLTVFDLFQFSRKSQFQANYPLIKSVITVEMRHLSLPAPISTLFN